MKTSILKTLENLKLTSDNTRKLFSTCTRDHNDLKVWKDELSGVIFIDEYYTGDDSYIKGLYRDDNSIISQTGKENFEEDKDAARRFETNFQFFSGKKVADFGCGKGKFLRLIDSHCESSIGIELQKNYVEKLNADNIKCIYDLDKVNDNSLDVCFSFHVLEHLPDPIKTLSTLKNKIVKGGKLIIEVNKLERLD